VTVRASRAPAPAYVERPLLDDGWVRASDVRCAATPPPIGLPEVERRPVFVFPLSGIFVREVQRGRSPLAILGDTAHAYVFRAGEPYRVRHPAGGADRSATISLSAAAADEFGTVLSDLPDLLPTDARTDLLLRRWLTSGPAVRDDPLIGGEVAAALVSSVVAAARQARPQARLVERDAVVEDARLVIATDIAERLTLPELGRRVGVSPFHLARRFRRATGSSLHGYRTTLRVRSALERVAAGERDLTRLALDLGFADHSHLTNSVRRAIGRPPAALRVAASAAELVRLRTMLNSTILQA
jgi:AraC family transcriptional regulator